MVKFIAGILVALAIAAVAYGGYYYGFNQAKTQSPIPLTQSTPPPTLTPQASPQDMPIPLRERPTAGMVNPSLTISAIEDAFANPKKNYALDLGAFMKDKVSLTIYATECCGSLQRKEASKQMDDYLQSSKLPWDCKDNNPIAKQLIQKNPDLFKDSVICTAANNYVAAFHITDDDFLIDKIVLAVDYKLITQ